MNIATHTLAHVAMQHTLRHNRMTQTAWQTICTPICRTERTSYPVVLYTYRCKVLPGCPVLDCKPALGDKLCAHLPPLDALYTRLYAGLMPLDAAGLPAVEPAGAEY